MKPPEKITLKEAYIYRHKPECARILADFYWRILLFAALCILLLSLAYGISKLSAVVAENDRIFLEGVTAVQPTPKFNTAQLEGTLSAFQERADRFNALKTGTIRIADPSR